MNATPDDRLLRRVAEGDRDALAEVFALHRERLRRIIAFRLDPRLSARIDVEDVLQEVYLHAQKSQHHVLDDPPGGLFVWFRMIAQQTLAAVHRRHLGTRLRDAGRERAPRAAARFTATSSSVSSFLLGHLTSPSQAILRKELAEQLDLALKSMSEVDREVLVLRHFEELTNLETARVLKLSEQAASIRYIRALRRLQGILKAIPGLSDDHRER